MELQYGRFYPTIHTVVSHLHFDFVPTAFHAVFHFYISFLATTFYLPSFYSISIFFLYLLFALHLPYISSHLYISFRLQDIHFSPTFYFHSTFLVGPKTLHFAPSVLVHIQNVSANFFSLEVSSSSFSPKEPIENGPR